jgi:hypothetical protein
MGRGARPQAECTVSAEATAGPKGARLLLLLRGLRVRTGMHTGVALGEAVVNKATSRVVYTGEALATAKAVGDAAQGAMTLLSAASHSKVGTARLQHERTHPPTHLLTHPPSRPPTHSFTSFSAHFPPTLLVNPHLRLSPFP